MTPFRWVIVGFWVIVAAMLIWQFNTYNRHLDNQAVTNVDAPTHFYYLPGMVTHAAPRKAPAPDVRQTGFTVDDKKPTPYNFIAHITLKNVGDLGAVNVHIRVRPYRGKIIGDEDSGHANLNPIDDNSALSQAGQWVDFPDLAPGQSFTKDATFYRQSGPPGINPNPTIDFEAGKTGGP